MTKNADLEKTPTKKTKAFVLDTNVLLHDPEAIIQFARHHIIIPVTVLEELDRLKRSPGELGYNARSVFRFLNSLHTIGVGDLRHGVKLPNQATVSVQFEKESSPSEQLFLDRSLNDNKILLAAYALKQDYDRVIFVSKDFAARIKAEALGIEAQDYENLKAAYDSIYRGIVKKELTKAQIDLFYKDGHLKVEGHAFHPNEYCVMTSAENSSAVGKYNPVSGNVESLLKGVPMWGLKPRNLEQKCAADLLLRDDIKLVTLIGPAGTGKTLFALAAGMRKVFDEGVYSRLLISRPIVPMGRDIGYLPGTKEEKLMPWMQPIFDNLEFLCDSAAGSGNFNETLRWVMDSKKVEMEAVTYIRGRSLPKVYIIVDEAQNLTPHEIKTIISRAGDGTKVVLTGDPTQIDNPYLDKDSNGLTYAVSKFAPYKLYGHMFLGRTERSELAALAAEVL